MHLLVPEAFFLALALPLWWLLRWRRQALQQRVKFPLPPRGATAAVYLQAAVPLLQSLGLLALVVALAGPQSWSPPTSSTQTGQAVVVVLDISASMEARDRSLQGEPVNRLQWAQAVLDSLLNRAPLAAWGLVVTAEDAYLWQSLSSDTALARANLQRLQAGVLPRQGSSLGNGLLLALNQLEADAVPLQSASILLVTDGGDNAGAASALDAAALLQQRGYAVVTLNAAPPQTPTTGPDIQRPQPEVLQAPGLQPPVTAADTAAWQANWLRRLAAASQGSLVQGNEPAEIALALNQELEAREPALALTSWRGGQWRSQAKMWVWVALGFWLAALLLRVLGWANPVMD